MRALTIGLLAVHWSFPAAAQWLYQHQESAFGGDSTHLALTADASYVFGLRCDGDGLVAIFATPEDLSGELGKKVSTIPVALLIRVDSNEVLSFDGAVDSIDGKMRVSAPVQRDLVLQIKEARTRVAVAMTIVGNRFHEVTFNVRGSTTAASRMLVACPDTE